MTSRQVILALACVIAISIGQMLFKIVGNAINASTSLISPRSVSLALLAFTIYGLASLAWIHLLRGVPLVRAYPFMALSFCFVPALAYFALNEKVGPAYLPGVILIVCGVLLIGRGA